MQLLQLPAEAREARLHRRQPLDGLRVVVLLPLQREDVLRALRPRDAVPVGRPMRLDVPRVPGLDRRLWIGRDSVRRITRGRRAGLATSSFACLFSFLLFFYTGTGNLVKKTT